MTVVFDTMVFLQNAARPHRLHASWRAVKDGRVFLCISGALIAEVHDVLNRDRIRRRFPALTPKVAEVFIADVLSVGKMFDPVPKVFTWTHHPDDDHIFNLAIAAKAGYLVTWENRIQNLASDTTDDAVRLRSLAPQLKIVTPKQFAESLRSA